MAVGFESAEEETEDLLPSQNLRVDLIPWKDAKTFLY